MSKIGVSIIGPTFLSPVFSQAWVLRSAAVILAAPTRKFLRTGILDSSKAPFIILMEQNKARQWSSCRTVSFESWLKEQWQERSSAVGCAPIDSSTSSVKHRLEPKETAVYQRIKQIHNPAAVSNAIPFSLTKIPLLGNISTPPWGDCLWKINYYSASVIV